MTDQIQRTTIETVRTLLDGKKVPYHPGLYGRSSLPWPSQYVADDKLRGTFVLDPRFNKLRGLFYSRDIPYWNGKALIRAEDYWSQHEGALDGSLREIMDYAGIPEISRLLGVYNLEYHKNRRKGLSSNRAAQDALIQALQ